MLKRIFLSSFGFILLLLVWQWTATSFQDLLFVLPAPSAIFHAMAEFRTRLLFHSLATLKEMVGGFTLALSLAFPIAWLMRRFTLTSSILQPFLVLLQCIPMFTLAPIMVIWFGWTYTAIVIPVALMTFFPLTLSIFQGLRSTPNALMEFFKSEHASGAQTFFKLELPHALPHIFAGFRISSAICGIGSIAGEWAGAQKGLGVLMLESRRHTDLELTFSALFCLAIMSLSFYGIVTLAEKLCQPKTIRWMKTHFRAHRTPKARKRKVVLAGLIVGCFVLFGLTACHKKNGSETRLVLDWLPNPNHIPLYVGVDQGFFEEEGIKLSIQKMLESGGGIAYLTSGQADLLVNHLPGTIRASSRGATVKIVGVMIKEPLNALIYRKDLNISRPKDLSGKILGYCIGGPDTLFLDHILGEGKIRPSSKKNVSVDLISAMGTENVDFIYGGFWNIEPFLLASLGVETESIKLEKLGVPAYYEMIIIGNAGTKETRPDYISRFSRALQKSIDFCLADPERAFERYALLNPDKREKTLIWERESWMATLPLLAKDQTVDPAIVTNFYEWSKSRGLFTHSFNYQRLLPYSPDL